MPFKPPDNPKCPKCGKSVYAAEERLAGGQKWHKTCFKCGMCNKMLDSTNCAEHEGQLFCKMCHGRQFGPKGYGFGGGAGCLSMDTGEQFKNPEGATGGTNNSWQAVNTKTILAPDGTGCPRCGGAVFAAEQMLAKGRQWHKSCFKCRNCSKNLDSTNHCDGPDNDIYCKLCYGKRFGPKGYKTSGATLMAEEDGEEPNLSNKPHLIIDTTSIMAGEGEEGCPRCGGKVYAAEEVLAKGKAWHRKCFKCCECKKTLDSINACDGPDHEIYCKTCYGKKYGPKGYGFACGSGFLSTDILPNEENDTQRPNYSDTTLIKPSGDTSGCPRCGGAVFAAEQMLAKGSSWHKRCFSCADCKRPLDSILACDGPDHEIYCKSCYGKKFGPKGYGYGYSPTLVTVGESTAPTYDPRPGGEGMKAPEGEGCGRCGFFVYAAEQMLCKGKVWHRRCFFCGECRRSLDSTNVNDAPDGDIYCKNCYARKYGPKGVGFGLGAGTLTMI